MCANIFFHFDTIINLLASMRRVWGNCWNIYTSRKLILGSNTLKILKIFKFDFFKLAIAYTFHFSRSPMHVLAHLTQKYRKIDENSCLK